MTNSLYAWASGHDVALASLNNIEAEVQTHYGRWPSLRALTEFVFSPPIKQFPNRVKTLDGSYSSEGSIKHYIEITEPEEAYEYQADLYLDGAVSAPITIYLRQKGRTGAEAWKRYNATLIDPDNDDEGGDKIYYGNGVLFIRWRLDDLVPLEEP